MHSTLLDIGAAEFEVDRTHQERQNQHNDKQPDNKEAILQMFTN